MSAGRHNRRTGTAAKHDSMGFRPGEMRAFQRKIAEHCRANKKLHRKLKK